MKPNDIKKLLSTASRLRDQETHPTPFFLISWTAWEATRTRMLRVAICHHGWLVAHADRVLGQLKISGGRQAEHIAVQLGMDRPSEWRGTAGRIWRRLMQIEKMRHRLSHGFDSLNPRLIRAAGNFVLTVVSKRQWLEQVVICAASGRQLPLGDIMATRRPRPIGERPAYGILQQKFNIDVDDQSFTPSLRLPSVAELEAEVVRLSK